ncbi:MAG: hypothetical protein U1E28_06355 [Beijerinckiaceae bacterium]
MIVIDLDEIETPAIDNTAAEIAASDLRIMNSLAYFNKVYDDTMSLISSGKIRDTDTLVEAVDLIARASAARCLLQHKLYENGFSACH